MAGEPHQTTPAVQVIKISIKTNFKSFSTSIYKLKNTLSYASTYIMMYMFVCVCDFVCKFVKQL